MRYSPGRDGAPKPMNTPKFLFAAVAATLLSTASFAVPPSADQVTVSPAMAKEHHGSGGGGLRMKALFTSPDQMMMFRMQMRDATHGMDRDHKKAYRRSEMQKVRGMTSEARGQWLQGLQAKWNALPENQKAHMERRMAKHEARRQERHGGQMGGQGQYQGAGPGQYDQGQGDDQGYAQPDGQPRQLNQSR